jgi:hypothetical protein
MGLGTATIKYILFFFNFAFAVSKKPLRLRSFHVSLVHRARVCHVRVQQVVAVRMGATRAQMLVGR